MPSPMVAHRYTLVWLTLLGLSLCVVSAQKHNYTYHPAHWMKDLQNILYKQSLLDISLPGTHDSGAYMFSDQLSPLNSRIVDDLIKICADLGIDLYTFIKNWSLTQNTTIYEQLSGGIRYLDLRANFVKGDWYTEHFLLGVKTQDLLNNVSKFMSENDGEIIVIELGNLDPVADEVSLVKMLVATLGKWLAPVMNLEKTTIGKMVEANHRIILLYPSTALTGNYSFLWNKTIFEEGGYANKNNLPEMETWNVHQINTYGGNGNIFELSWTLTTQDSDIVKTLLDPFLRERTLKDFAVEANAALGPWAQQYHNYQLGNIMLMDFWEFSNLVNLTIEFNLRQCHDDPSYIAVVPSGEFCRNYFLQGNCTEPRHENWMKEHCRLSCGVC